VKLRASVLSLAALSGLLACMAAVPVSARTYVDIEVRPPEPRVVEVPAPRHGYVWAPGYWQWNGHKHVWVDGRWLRERHGSHWVPAHWEDRHGRYHFEQGRWERG
jgi:hypothetical protein